MKLMFIHIPKTGGTSFRKSLNKEIIYGGHTLFIPFKDQPKNLNQYFLNNDNKKWTKNRGIPNVIDGIYSPKLNNNIITFTIIRNPFDMLSSLYFHDSGKGFGHLGGNSHPESIKHTTSFKDFIIKYCSDNWNYAGGIPCPYLKLNLFQQIFDKDGNIKVDIILFNEKLNEGLEFLKKKFNINCNKILKKNISTHKKKNYKDYYDQEMIDLVNKKCHLELSLFNYSFDGYHGKDNFILTKNKNLKIKPL